MAKKRMVSKDPDIIGSYAALRQPAKRALQIVLETDTAVCVPEGGKIVDLNQVEAAERQQGLRRWILPQLLNQRGKLREVVLDGLQW